MAPPKKSVKTLSRTGKYYRRNKKARDKKDDYNTELNKRPEQRAKRSELTMRRRKDREAGKDIDGKDYDHAAKRYVSSKTNRGRKNGTPGDRRARGKKR